MSFSKGGFNIISFLVIFLFSTFFILAHLFAKIPQKIVIDDKGIGIVFAQLFRKTEKKYSFSDHIFFYGKDIYNGQLTSSYLLRLYDKKKKVPFLIIVEGVSGFSKKQLDDIANLLDGKMERKKEPNAPKRWIW